MPATSGSLVHPADKRRARCAASRECVLILAVAHGAVDLALSGHVSTTGKGHTSPDDLVDDLLDDLHHAR
ncbi:MAG: hypothetical protein ACRDOK_26040 [Streptosporangiaceae bacterium]